MSVVEVALKRPYTVVAMLILISLMGIGAALRMPVDIFPEIDIPVVAVVWTYNGMSAQDMQNRILTLHERQLASLVDDISRIEAMSYQGVGVEKIYLHEGADVTRADLAAREQRAWSCSSTCRPTSRRRWCCATARPTCRSSSSACRASRCPTPSSTTWARTSFVRPSPWCTAPRFRIPTAASRASSWRIWISQALQARGLSPADVSAALQRQNVILPAGDVKIGDKDYTLDDEQLAGRHRHHQCISHQADRRPHRVHARCCACSRRLPGADQFGLGQRHARRADDHPQDRRRVDARGDRRRARRRSPTSQKVLPQGRVDQGAVRSVGLRQGGAQQRADERLHGGRPDRAGHHSVPRQCAPVPDHSRGHPAVDHHRRAVHLPDRTNPQHHDAWAASRWRSASWSTTARS